MEEEIENEKFKIVKVFDEFPRIIHFSIPNSCDNSTIHVYESPFKNCQTFTIGGANRLDLYSKEDMKSLFKKIVDILNRTQLVIDTNDECTEDILDKINDIAYNIQSMPYKSTNDSSMTLSLIQLKDLK